MCSTKYNSYNSFDGNCYIILFTHGKLTGSSIFLIGQMINFDILKLEYLKWDMHLVIKKNTHSMF